MAHIQFGTCEFCFPCWGSAAIVMTRAAGFDGILITDGGGYLQPHPQNNGFVEYERFGLDLQRKDSFPLTDRRVQEDYLEAAETHQVRLQGIYLYLLNHQGFIKYADRTPQGRQCLETIRNAVIAASQMGIPSVTVPAAGMFGVGQHSYALDKLRYAADVGAEYGVQIFAALGTGKDYCEEVLDALKGRVLLDFDTLDPTLRGTGDAPAMIRALGRDHAGRFRVRDMTADGEGFLTQETGTPAPLGRGDGRFGPCAGAIRETGYTGWIFSQTPYYSAALYDGDSYVTAARRDLETLKNTFCGE